MAKCRLCGKELRELEGSYLERINGKGAIAEYSVESRIFKDKSPRFHSKARGAGSSSTQYSGSMEDVIGNIYAYDRDLIADANWRVDALANWPKAQQ